MSPNSDNTVEKEFLLYMLKTLESAVSNQFELIKELREENASLLEILLKQYKILPEEEKDIDIEIPQFMKSVGREPWYKLKSRLQFKYKKPKLSEISGINDINDIKDQEDAEIIG